MLNRRDEVTPDVSAETTSAETTSAETTSAETTSAETILGETHLTEEYAPPGENLPAIESSFPEEALFSAGIIESEPPPVPIQGKEPDIVLLAKIHQEALASLVGSEVASAFNDSYAKIYDSPYDPNVTYADPQHYRPAPNWKGTLGHQPPAKNATTVSDSWLRPQYRETHWFYGREMLKPLPTLDVGPVRFQGDSGSCWAHAHCGLWFSEMVKRDPDAAFPSVQWLVHHAGEKSCVDGNTTNAAFAISAKYGMLPEGSVATDPINKQYKCATLVPSKFQTSYAKLYQGPVSAVPYLFNDDESPEEADLKIRKIYQSISDGYPVVVGILVGNEFNDAEGATPVRVLSGGPDSGHAVIFCGYDLRDGLACFRVKNSWGVESEGDPNKILPWADNGYCWLSTETASQWTDAISYASNPKAFPTALHVFALTADLEVLTPLDPDELRVIVEEQPHPNPIISVPKRRLPAPADFSSYERYLRKNLSRSSLVLDCGENARTPCTPYAVDRK